MIRSVRLRTRSRRRGGNPTSIRDTLDDLAKDCVMMRAGAALFEDVPGRKSWFGTCQRCNTPHWLCWCHVFTRACYGTRWDLDNAFAWCKGCHRTMDQHWETKRDYTLERIGQAAFDRLSIRARARGLKVDMDAVKLYLMAQAIRIREGRRT